MNKKDVQILDDLRLRTENLPDILHLRAAEANHQFSEDDKKLLFDTYLNLMIF
jgi:hypothetical protein